MHARFSTSLITLVVLAGCNAPPDGLQVSLSPTEPMTTDELVVSIDSEATDPNDDSVTYRYLWTRDGDVVTGQEQATLPSNQTEKGETWEVTVTPDDGKTLGPTATATVQIVNAPPTVEAALSPAEPLTDDNLVVDVQSVDPDLDPVTVDIRWILNGSPTEVSENRMPSQRTSKGDVWEVVLTPNDGEVDGEQVTVSVTIGNTPPSVETAEVRSDTGRIDRGSALQCVGLGWEDIDDDAEGYTVRWFVNGSETPGDAGVLTSGFARGDEVYCELTPFDGDDPGVPVNSAPVDVQNTPPSLASVSIGPEDPVRGQDVVATLGEATDIDGDPVSFLYSWRVDGREAGSAESLPSSRFVRGSRIEVVVTPTDGTDNGEPVTSNQVEGGNNPPEVTSVNLDPSTVYTDTSLVALVKATDPDGDELSSVVAWYVNGSRVSASTTTLEGSTWFDKGDTIYAEVQADDGFDTGPALTSASVTVLNSPPTAPEISLSPSEPTEGDDITCVMDSVSTDADSDSLTYTFSWTVEGTPTAGSTTTYTNDTLSASDWTEEDRVVCTVVANDGTEDGPEAEARTAGISTDLDFPSTTSSTKSGALGSGGGGRFFRTGDYVTETFKATGVPEVDELYYEVEMDDRTTSVCKVGTLRFSVMINGTEVDTYSYTGGSTLGRIKFDDTVSFSKISGTGSDGDDYTLRIEAKDTVCPGASSWNWFPGGTFTLNP